MTLAWPDLIELDAYRITEIPRRTGPGAPPDRQTLAGRNGSPRWSRPTTLASTPRPPPRARWPWGGSGTRPAVRSSCCAAGPGLVGGTDDAGVRLTLPGGARAQPLPRGALGTLTAQLPCWRAIGAISDGPRPEGARRTGQRPSGVPPSLEECLLAVWPGAFGWLLVAEPGGGRRAGPGRLDRAVAVRLAAGGTDADAATRVAGLVCAAAGLAELPYALAPATASARGLPELMQDTSPAPARRRRGAGLSLLRQHRATGRLVPAARAGDPRSAADAAARLRRHPGACRRAPGDRRGRDPGSRSPAGRAARAAARLAAAGTYWCAAPPARASRRRYGRCSRPPPGPGSDGWW